MTLPPRRDLRDKAHARARARTPTSSPATPRMTITQISRASLLPRTSAFDWDLVPLPEGRSATTRSSARPASACCKTGKNAAAAADFLAYLTNPANSAKLAQFFPLAAQVAAQRRDARQDQPAAHAGSSCDRVVVAGIATGRRCRPTRTSPSCSRLVRAASTRCGSRRPTSRPSTRASAPRSLRCWRSEATPWPDTAPAAELPAAPPRPFWTIARRDSAAGCCSSRRSWPGTLVFVLVPLALVFWYSLHEWNVLADTFNYTGAGTTSSCSHDPSLPSACCWPRRCSRSGWWCST